MINKAGLKHTTSCLHILLVAFSAIRHTYMNMYYYTVVLWHTTYCIYMAPHLFICVYTHRYLLTKTPSTKLLACPPQMIPFVLVEFDSLSEVQLEDCLFINGRLVVKLISKWLTINAVPKKNISRLFEKTMSG